MMISLENKDTMQQNYEASIIGFQNNDPSATLPYNATYFRRSPELHDGFSAKPGGNVIDPDHSSSSERIESPKICPQRPFYHQDLNSRFANHDSNNIPLAQLNAYEGPFYPYAVNYRFHYVPTNMCPQKYSYNHFQEFQYFVVIDFEATCDKARTPHPQEIIEFPSVIVSSLTGQLEACFQTYVRPTCNQLLTDFCKDLTGIQQIQVDRGVTLSEALLRHDKWLENKGIKNTNFAVVTWSNWDCRVMLESECRYKKIRKPPYFNRWINLRVPFQEVFGGMRCNLKEAVEKAGLSWQGRPHCGLDDAKNTARLLALLMHRGFKFSITNELSQSNDGTPVPEKTVDVPPPQAQKLLYPCCFCGVLCSKGVIRKPGPKQDSLFFSCGFWTITGAGRCPYFRWASSP